MKRFLIILTAFVLVVGSTAANAGGNKVIHRVSIGGADFCEALGLPTGCDANFSLVANMRADGSVKGQWQDTFGAGAGGIHVAIDCLNIVDDGIGDLGAVIGGVITHGTDGISDFAGLRALTAVADHGTSAKDPLDMLSYSFIGDDRDCTILDPFTDFPLFFLTHGQVKVR